ncbi:MAG TPA: 2-dehydropantoate 2-reductase, partial [Verrucomicrobiales bacterium]|nr:2-dehydropantoate 2-reductase [Verrucomicrobiales bacterium]
RTHELAQAFRHSGVPCTVSDNLARAHWEKLVWNIPFNGLGVASSAGLDAMKTGHVADTAAIAECLTTDRLLADPDWLSLVRELMGEVIAAAHALGHPIPDSYADLQVQRTREMGAYRASTLIDFERGQALELESLFAEPLRQAQAAGVAMPRLAALTKTLERLAELRKRG